MGYRSSTERHLEEIADRSTAIIAERACDPGFTIDDIVRAVYCSRRQVQRAFASRGTTFRQELFDGPHEAGAGTAREHRA